MKLTPPASPDEHLMRNSQCHGNPEPGRRADSPKLSNLDGMDAFNPYEPDEEDSKQRRMKPLLFKDQLNLRHALSFETTAQRNIDFSSDFKNHMSNSWVAFNPDRESSSIGSWFGM
jgi:hypothetical protein